MRQDKPERPEGEGLEAERPEAKRPEAERLKAERLEAERQEATRPAGPRPKQTYSKPGDKIKYFTDGERKQVEVTSNAGKATERNKA